MDVADLVVKPIKGFAKDSIRLVNKCTKPDRKEFTKISLRTALGFAVLGFIGFFVKLIFIPMRAFASTDMLCKHIIVGV